jgi:D-lactate dehydrogenase (cytochrome)
MRCEIPGGSPAAVYLEYHGDAGSVDRAVGDMAKILVAHGGERDSMWAGSSDEDIANFKQIKHMHPEVLNGLVAEQQRKDPRIHKLGTDLAVPDDRADELMALYRSGLGENGFEYQMFGHLGDNNVHVNIIPHSFEQYEAGRRLHLEWARAAVKMGGTVSAEHGIGKMKKALLKEMYSPGEIDQMAEVKRCFDPAFLLNPGNIFDPPQAT